MKPSLMVTFRCPEALFERLEAFGIERNLDRTSILRLALRFYLNAPPPRPKPPERPLPR